MEKIATNKTIAQRFHKDNDFKLKVNVLKSHITLSHTFDILDHRAICLSFGLPYLPEVFRRVYDQRLLSSISETPLTAATISKVTGLKHKYVCQVKRRLQKANILTVAYLGRCPTTGSKRVQFLTLNTGSNGED